MNRLRLSKFASAMAVLCLSVAWLAACKSSPASQPLPLIQDEIQGGEPPEFTFGIIYPLVHPYYEIVTAEAERAAEALGGRLIIKAPDEANLEQQIRMIEDMVRKQVDGIAISPIDSEALTPYIDYAVEAGIPVICFETDAPNSLRLTYIGGDNEHAGGLMGQALKNIMGDEGMVLVEYGMPGMHSQKMRLNGFIDYIRDYTNIQVLEVRSHGGNEDQALYEIEQMIDAHPHFDAFISLDYLSGASSIIAWKAMGLNRYSLTFGLMPAIEEAIINGQISLAISQNEEKWGARIVGALRDLTMNKKLPDIIHLGDRIIDARDVMNKAAANM